MTFGKIGARKMMYEWKNPYVTKGLIAMWDGEWNSGGGVHDAAATTWVDLSGNGYDIAIPSSGAVWGDDKISLVSTSLSADLPQVGRPEFTIECVANGQYGGSSYVWMRNPSWIGGSVIGQAYGFNVWYPWASLGTLGHSVWESTSAISLSWDQSRQACRLNGQEVLSATGSVDSRNVLSKVYIGEFNGTKTTSLDGYTFRLYNRALSASEIASNYAVDKERFNLP